MEKKYLIENKRSRHNATNDLNQSKVYYFNSVNLWWWNFLQHITRSLCYQLTYAIWLFCHIVTINYFNRVTSLGHTIWTFLTGLMVCTASVKIKMAMTCDELCVVNSFFLTRWYVLSELLSMHDSIKKCHFDVLKTISAAVNIRWDMVLHTGLISAAVKDLWYELLLAWLISNVQIFLITVHNFEK